MTQQQAVNMVYFLEMTSLRMPAVREPRIPPSCRMEVSQPVAVGEETTLGKFSLKRYMASDWERMPCW